MPLLADIWRVGLAHAPIANLTEPGALERAPITWLDPGPAHTFIADPFGLWRDGRLHLFAEAYDYRTRHGIIDHLLLDDAGQVVERRTVLREPWHLSYPFVFEAEGETWMSPEGFRSGRLTFYRAVEFPYRWEPAVTLELDGPAIDATPFRHDGLWWLAYSPSGSQADKQGKTHLAYAEKLTGPWRLHPGNPVRVDRSSSRPGGTPFVQEGLLRLPVQDCSRTYGGAMRLLTVHELSPTTFQAEASEKLVAPSSAGEFRHGLHTLAACGDVTFVDAKKIAFSLEGLAIDVQRKIRKRAAP
jgi:hypothetical protein